MESLQLQWAKSFMGAPAELQNLNNLFDYLKGSKYEIYIQLLLKEERRKNPFRESERKH